MGSIPTTTTKFMAQSVKGRQLRFQRENRSSTLRWATILQTVLFQ